MQTDGGGWTLVAYAGKITGNKEKTAGTKSFWPLFSGWGTYDPAALKSRKAFSRLDLFENLMGAKSRFMARRTSVPGKILIWPVANKTS